MKEYILKHLYYYIIFGLIQIIGFVTLLALSGNHALQILVIFILTGAYIFWAILHHYLEHSLSPRIVLEYVLFGVFGVVIALFYFK